MRLLLQTLRDANRRLSFWLDSMAAVQVPTTAVTPEHISALLSELLRVGTGLRAEPISRKGVDPELDAELEKYRSHMERLRDLLPSMHCQLLAERARIETQRTRVQSVAAWARASRQTL